ncbi:hypothetical protein [Halorhodospira halophila]|uniref:Uncharacterized protein n=1 Tax=Halorhodospira halophila (strain DSM 244 / SL1) TaxID=349124 RepID=A1WWU1_HALHL|nr:hypothetical protein [Halorhodospira halophila]ABM62153.1 hypothetical protein Hhal_1386 [Halorhodospira halophila SL1]MBK1729481.1 hypothetical protein [Halorhodospira halophila]
MIGAMALTGISIVATVLALLIWAVAASYERQAEGLNAQVARDVKYWQRGAAIFFIISLLPSLISRPAPDLPRAVYETLSGLAPVFLLFGLLCFGAALSKLIPAWRRHREAREREQRRRQVAARGGPYPELSAALADSIRQCLPELEVATDQHSPEGHHASLVIESPMEQQRYVIYALPREHLHLDGGRGVNPNAVRRACETAAAFSGRPILWAPMPSHGTPQGYAAEGSSELRPYIVEGKDIHLAETVKKFDLAARSERRRRETREAARAASEGDPRHHIPIRSETSSDRGRRQHDRESWERFNLLAPRHPHIVEEVERRTRELCDRCLMQIPEGNGEVVVTDHDHICKNDASVRIALNEGNETLTQHMPDCGQCHYETPELYEECLSRLTLVHSGRCPANPDDPEEIERQQEYEQRARMEALGRSFRE